MYTLFFSYSQYATAGSINIYPVTLRDGYESQMSLDWRKDHSHAVLSNKHFLSSQELAAQSGIKLSTYLDAMSVAKFDTRTGSFFLLFHNMVQSHNCGNDYLIQRVKVRKLSYNRYGARVSDQTQYLVEVMKTWQGHIKKSDQHRKRYLLNSVVTRAIYTDIEIGCGTIPGVVEGQAWPFNPYLLYKMLQDYSDQAGIYDHIQFEFSKKYTYDFTFSRTGESSISYPYFIKQFQ